MKKIYLILPLIFIMYSCELLNEYLEEPVPPTEVSNPGDPADENYVEPLATIVSGPEEGAVITENSVEFQWSGTKSNHSYKYFLENYDNDWVTSYNTSKSFINLADGNYTFKIVEIDNAPIPAIEQSTPTTRSFSINVNPYTGTVLRFSESSATTYYTSYFTVDIVLENISNLSGADVRLIYNPAKLQLSNIQLGEFFANNNASSPLYFIQSNYCQLSSGILGQANGISGSGAIFRITFQAIDSGSTILSFSSSHTQLRDNNNNNIHIDQLGTCTVTIN